MKRLRIYLIFIMFLLSTQQQLQGMVLKTKPPGRMPILVPDSDVSFPVTIEDENGHVVYSSQWSPTQLTYFSTLHNQYAFNPDSDPVVEPINIPQSLIPNLEAFRLVEQASAVLEANDTQQNEHKKYALKKYFTETTQPRELNALLRISDFLNSPLIYDACKENAVTITKELIKNQQLSRALSFLQQFNNHYDAIYLGNHLMTCSPSIQRLLIKLQKTYDINKIEGNRYRWQCLPKQDDLFFKSRDNNTLKFWHNNALKTLHCKNQNYLYNTWICSATNKVFCVFRNTIDGSDDYYTSLEICDLDTGTFLCSKRISQEPILIRYVPQKNLLLLINGQTIKKYLLTTNDITPTLSKKEIFSLPGMSNFTVNTYDGTVYFIKDQKIYKYDPEKNTARVYFSQTKKLGKIHGLCISPIKRMLYFLTSRKRNKKHEALHKLNFYNLDEEKIQRTISLKNSSAEKISISPDETMLALSQQNKLILLDTESGQRLKVLNRCHFPVAFSLDSTTLAARHQQGYIEHTFLDDNLRKELHHFPIDHIALLLAYANSLESKNEIIPLSYANHSDQTRILFRGLPSPIRIFLEKSDKHLSKKTFS